MIPERFAALRCCLNRSVNSPAPDMVAQFRYAGSACLRAADGTPGALSIAAGQNAGIAFEMRDALAPLEFAVPEEMAGLPDR